MQQLSVAARPLMESTWYLVNWLCLRPLTTHHLLMNWFDLIFFVEQWFILTESEILSDYGFSFQHWILCLLHYSKNFKITICQIRSIYNIASEQGSKGGTVLSIYFWDPCFFKNGTRYIYTYRMIEWLFKVSCS